MAHSTLYDDDILLWSEQQAEIIRKLGQMSRGLPNEFDPDNVAEEIESVGRSELASVRSQIQNVLSHLIKLSVEPDSEAARHWRAELFAFHEDMRRHYSPSMGQRIDLEREWWTARRLAVLRAPPDSELENRLPTNSPFDLAELVGEELDADALAERLRTSM